MDGAATVIANLDRLVEQLQANVEAAAAEIALLLEADSKPNHPWITRTGALESSIHGRWEREGRELVTVYLSAGMEYAVFLELLREGKWAWLWPAVERNLDRMEAILRRHLGL